MKKIMKNKGVQSFVASVICIVLGLLIGYLALLIIEPSGARKGILDLIKNFMSASSENLKLKLLGNCLVRTAPLLMCSLSVLFSYKVGLFNIGVAGQYTLGAGMALIFALYFHAPWFVCVLAAVFGGALLAAISGLLKAFFNVNEVISGIMLNWISLYFVNIMLSSKTNGTEPGTLKLQAASIGSRMPKIGFLDEIFGNKGYFGIAVPLSIVFAVAIWILLTKTKFGYEIQATGLNKNAAKYCGMAEKRNIVLSLVISGILAGLGGSFLYLTDINQWETSASALPAMGFNGIAAAFLGGLNPIGAIFSSFFIQHITDGGGRLDTKFYFSQISDLISAFIIYLCGFVGFVKYMMNKEKIKSSSKAKKQSAGKGGNE